MQKISFCLPEQSLPDAACKKAWAEGKVVPRTEYTTFYNWIYQSWNLLQEAGMTLPLSTQPLEQGVVITLGSYLTNVLGMDNKLPEDVFLIDVMADGMPHPAAHLHLSQNKTQTRYLPSSLFMPFWSQARLIPRDPKRGHRVENICFFGDEKNLTPELRTEKWQLRLKQELGISFQLRGNTGWHDYSTIDGIIAIRDFSRSPHFHKPATKLYNAWQAGVPFIGGRDSAYSNDGSSGKDYLVATSPEEVFQYLKRLKEEPVFYSNLIQNGFQSSTLFTRTATLERWKNLIQTIIPNLVTQWEQTSATKRLYIFYIQRFSCFLDRYFR